MAAAVGAEDREPFSTAVIYLLGAVVAGIFCLLTVYMGGRSLFGPAEITVPRFETRVIADGALSASEIAEDASFHFRDASIDVDAWRATAVQDASQDPNAFIQQVMDLAGRGEVEVRVQRYRLIPFGEIVIEVLIYMAAIGLLAWLTLRFLRDAATLRRSGHFADGTTVGSRQFG